MIQLLNNKHSIVNLRLYFSKFFNLIFELFSILPDYFKFYFSKKTVLGTKRLVFCGTIMHARIGRISKWIKRLYPEIEIVLICKKSGFSSLLVNSSFDKIVLYRNIYHLKYIIREFDNSKSIFHLFGPPYEASYSALKQLEYAKCVYDYQDLYVSNYGMSPPFHYMKKGVIKEKYVIQNCDGIISHSLELQSAKKEYSITTPRIYFPIYNDNDSFKEPRFKRNKLSIVYVGSVYSNYRDKKHFGSCQFHWLIEAFENQKIDFHIYPSPVSQKEDLADYVHLDKELNYFHLHNSIDQNSLSEELNEYDFGILPFFKNTSNKNIDKRIFSTTLKVFNFSEAGLPVLISSDLGFQKFISKRIGASVEIERENLNNLKEFLLKVNKEELMKNFKSNRLNYSLEKNIHKLTDFYSEISRL